ncbi:MAG: hypothetical protein AAF492_09020 [Verrucomicrobiota bacterium]
MKTRLFRWAVTGLMALPPSIPRSAEKIPHLCGTCLDAVAPPASEQKDPPPSTQKSAGLPLDSWAWECVPSVIRADQTESFILEVEVGTGTAVSNIVLDFQGYSLAGPAPGLMEMRDDGLPPDREADDQIYSAGPWTTGPLYSLPPHYNSISSGIDQVAFLSLGSVTLTRSDASTETFLSWPLIGILSTNVPAIPSHRIGENHVVTPHLINVRGDRRDTQRFLHRVGLSKIQCISKPIYDVLPNNYDFLNFFSVDRVERIPRLDSRNFVRGKHLTTFADFTGTRFLPTDVTAIYGGAGRLLGLNVVDVGSRGLSSDNLCHEILHQWSAYLPPGSPLASGSHYNLRTSAASLLGGYRWDDDGMGNFVFNCNEGRNGATEASPLDKYFMGLIPGSNVPPQYAITDTSIPFNSLCGNVVTHAYEVVTVDDIQAVYGVRTPGPDTAQRRFNMGFIAESFDRFLNETELTFFDRFAAYVTGSIPSNAPTPYMGGNWEPIERYFGENTIWSSAVGAVLDIERTGSNQVDVNVGNLALEGDFRLQETADLLAPTWSDRTGPAPTPPGHQTRIVISNAPARGYLRALQER